MCQKHGDESLLLVNITASKRASMAPCTTPAEQGCGHWKSSQVCTGFNVYVWLKPGTHTFFCAWKKTDSSGRSHTRLVQRSLPLSYCVLTSPPARTLRLADRELVGCWFSRMDIRHTHGLNYGLFFWNQPLYHDIWPVCTGLYIVETWGKVLLVWRLSC